MPTKTMMNLTQAAANGVEASGTKQRFPDHKVRGLELRVAPGGTKAWVVRYRGLDGTSREMKIGAVDKMPIEQARKLARIELANVPSGEEPLQKRQQAKREAIKSKERTVVAIIERYRQSPAYTEKRQSTRDTYDNSFDRHIIPRIGERPIVDIKRGDVSMLLDDLLIEHTGNVSNQARSALSVVMAFAVERDIIDFNPVQGVKAKHKTPVRERVLSETELKGLWESLEAGVGVSPLLADMLRLLMLLPARAQEIAGMQWEELDLGEALWKIPKARMKGNEDHELPLGTEAMVILKTLQTTATTSWVFPNLAGTDAMSQQRPSRACNRFCKTNGWPNFGTHDLRRTIATGLAGLSFDTATIERMLGHKVGAGRAIINYDHHDYRDKKRRAVEAWEGKLMQIIRGDNMGSNVSPLIRKAL